MPTFELTARYDVGRANGLRINRGQQFTVNINMVGITPNNLFGNNRCVDQLVYQFKLNGIDVPKTDAGIYNRGLWDIKIK